MFPPACAARFEPVRRLAEGGFGEVHLARQVELDRLVVVKLLRPEGLADAAVRGRFRREAMLTAALQHPHIVVLIDHDVDDAVPWIAYEYVAGETLARRLAAGALPWPDAVRAARQIGAALACAHAAGVLHRDVKPDNVLCARDDHVKVADFGLAKSGSAAGFQTAAGLLLGTPDYLAPELVAGAEPDARADQYALGVTLYEMLAGAAPFTRASVFDTLQAHAEAPVPPLEEPRVPRGVAAVVMRMLAKAPGERFASAADAVAALAELEGGGGAEPAAVAGTAPKVSRSVRVPTARIARTAGASGPTRVVDRSAIDASVVAAPGPGVARIAMGAVLAVSVAAVVGSGAMARWRTPPAAPLPTVSAAPPLPDDERPPSPILLPADVRRAQLTGIETELSTLRDLQINGRHPEPEAPLRDDGRHFSQSELEQEVRPDKRLPLMFPEDARRAGTLLARFKRRDRAALAQLASRLHGLYPVIKEVPDAALATDASLAAVDFLSWCRQQRAEEIARRLGTATPRMVKDLVTAPVAFVFDTGGQEIMRHALHQGAVLLERLDETSDVSASRLWFLMLDLDAVGQRMGLEREALVRMDIDSPREELRRRLAHAHSHKLGELFWSAFEAHRTRRREHIERALELVADRTARVVEPDAPAWNSIVKYLEQGRSVLRPSADAPPKGR